MKDINEKRNDNILDAAKSGDRLRTLIALRDLLAERLQEADSDRDISSMSRRLMQCISEIEAIRSTRSKTNNVEGLRNRYKLGKIDDEHEYY